MISDFGYLTLALAFLLSVYGLIAAVWGTIQKSQPWVESARLALILIFPLLTVSLLALTVLLLDNRFDVAYVYSVTSRDMPNYLKITALWGGQSGSLLVWSWLLGGFSTFFILRKWRKDYNFLPWVLIVILVTLGFFLMLSVFIEIPFERFWQFPDGSRVMSVFQPRGAWALMPPDGQGLNPLLRHPAMIWHPPALYLGFVGFIIPFALAIAALVSGQNDRRWIEIARPWTLTAWVFLTLGLVLGMRWAYDVLGWGGYWGWDPVEISALMPWLSATAFLHTAMLQKRRNAFSLWNLVLIILTFVLVIFGTFLTRTGVLSSVHSFAGSDIGLPLFVFTAVLSLSALGILIYRWSTFRSDYEPKFGFSKEVLTLFSNLVLLSILAACFLGVIYPIASDLLTGTSITVGPAWYERITGPLFMLLLLLLGICPLTAWCIARLSTNRRLFMMTLSVSLLVPFIVWLLADIRDGVVLIAFWLVGFAVLTIFASYLRDVYGQFQASHHLVRSFWTPVSRNYRRYGGVLVHLGILLMGVGIIGIEGLQQETQVTLSIGESVSLGNYRFVFEGLEQYIDGEGLSITEGTLAVSRDDFTITTLNPQRQIFVQMGMAITQPALDSNLARDLYAILVDWDQTTQEEATFRIFINPLMNWLWIGAGVVTIGTVLALWPERFRKRLPAY